MTHSNKDLAVLVTEVIEQTSRKFSDPLTGLAPDFMLSIMINSSGVERGTYIPILNHWGFDSFDYLTYQDNGSLVLPWTHVDTFRYLNDLPEDSIVPDPLRLNGFGTWNAAVGGIRAGQVLFYKNGDKTPKYPNIISGGTRTSIDIIRGKMRRPWQKEAPKHNIQDCPMCNRTQKDEVVYGDLKSFSNPYTPFSWHKMITPTRKFHEVSKVEDYYLYNSLGFNEVLNLAEKILVESGRESAKLGVHKGYSAGQNLGHLHFHLLSYDSPIKP